jgi:hypothetical protein
VRLGPCTEPETNFFELAWKKVRKKRTGKKSKKHRDHLFKAMLPMQDYLDERSHALANYKLWCTVQFLALVFCCNRLSSVRRWVVPLSDMLLGAAIATGFAVKDHAFSAAGLLAFYAAWICALGMLKIAPSGTRDLEDAENESTSDQSESDSSDSEKDPSDEDEGESSEADGSDEVEDSEEPGDEEDGSDEVEDSEEPGDEEDGSDEVEDSEESEPGDEGSESQ